MFPRIRCDQISGVTSTGADKGAASLIGGLYMWHKDSKGNWYMAENEIGGSGDTGSAEDNDPILVHKVPAVSSLGLGPESSIYLFSSLARGA